MLEAAKKIESYANSFYCSDRELEVMSQKFYSEFRIQWFEVV